MRRLIGMLAVGALGLSLGLAARAAEALQCPPDAVPSGTICIDKYEASVWKVSSTNGALIRKIRLGTVIRADLTALGGGATQYGLAAGDLAAAGCATSGNNCTDFYAVSIAAVTPAAFITWFQAVAAARNADKRLPTNQEWQAAALGTPDPGTDNGTTNCNISAAGAVVNTGSRSACASNVGAMDMVGNVAEWVAEWIMSSIKGRCTDSSNPLFNDDLNCLSGDNQSGGSGSAADDVTVEAGTNALYRGGAGTGSASAGGSAGGTRAGVFFVDHALPTLSRNNTGFRAAR